MEVCLKSTMGSLKILIDLLRTRKITILSKTLYFDPNFSQMHIAEMLYKKWSKSTRNKKEDTGLGRFQTHAFDEMKILNGNYVDYSESQNSKSEMHRSMSAKSCHSTEPQSRNPSKQVYQKPLKLQSALTTHQNPSFMTTSAQQISQHYTSKYK